MLSLLAGLDSRRFDSEGLLSSFIRELPDGTTQAGNKSSVASKLLLHTHTHASANGQSERKMRRWRKKEEKKRVNTREEEEGKKTDEGGQAKETDG